MDKPLSLRRLAENEVVFRQKNREVEEGFVTLKKLADEHGQENIIDDRDLLLQFYCECSDESCTLRIPLKRSQYDSIHKANDKFVVTIGHEVLEVERVIEKTHEYCVVVKKIDLPPAPSTGLNRTPITNV